MFPSLYLELCTRVCVKSVRKFAECRVGLIRQLCYGDEMLNADLKHSGLLAYSCILREFCTPYQTAAEDGVALFVRCLPHSSLISRQSTF